MYVEKTKAKNYATIIVIAMVVLFVSTIAVISVYDLIVHDISNNLNDLCARYGYLISPGCQ
ncbi:MAG TPA: hypothetical protein VK250_04770 [Nitrososphaeraceae archaeon]|nr:hypothetical protein [Nitrososphaeraceae archaeon]